MQKDLKHPAQREIFIKEVKKILDAARRSKNKKGFWVSVKRVYEKRSNSQNRYLHLMFKWVQVELGWNELDRVKRLYKDINEDVFLKSTCTLTNSRELKSTSELSTAEMEACNSKFRNYMSMQANIYIRLPNEPDYEAWKYEAERDIKLARQFLD